MTWIRLDDNLPDHPKLLCLSDKAFRLFITSLCYSGRYLTDGYITTASLVVLRGDDVSVGELVDGGLWDEDAGGWHIHDYTEYQPTRSKVTKERAKTKERVQKWRERNAVTNADVTRSSNADSTRVPSHPIPSQIEQQVQEPSTDIALPRVNSARDAVKRISDKLAQARAAGINAWNLSNLIGEEWNALHAENDIGGCIALTCWYVSELQSRNLTSAEIARIGQMTKRFGRIALLAVDQAASKELDDLVSYAFKVAQGMHKEMSS